MKPASGRFMQKKRMTGQAGVVAMKRSFVTKFLFLVFWWNFFKGNNVPNFVSYENLSKKINDIDIGQLYNISPILTEGIDTGEIVEGVYRNVSDFKTCKVLLECLLG